MINAGLLLEERRKNLDKEQESSKLKAFLYKMNPRSITGVLKMITEVLKNLEQAYLTEENLKGRTEKYCAIHTRMVQWLQHTKVLCANMLGQSRKAVWIMDSGATHHRTPYRELIENFDGSLEPIKDGDIKVMNENETIFKALNGGSDVYLLSCQAYKANGKHRRMGHSTSLPAVCDTSSSYRDCDTHLKGKIKRTGFTDSVKNQCSVGLSALRQVKVLKKKFDVAEAIKQYQNRVEIFKEKKRLQSDNGGEYIGKEFEKHLRERNSLEENCSIQPANEWKSREAEPNFDEHDKKVKHLIVEKLDREGREEKKRENNILVVKQKCCGYHDQRVKRG
ncbi:hypothetical protein PR048_022306 [Dryococelus australis]|uniref:Integrase catalytic domain-containing protein n=1 Tax=Dryococelus australis TaxID=614101 RepID=A0ABQ9H0N5_9NEOP|nr:hypothetical protein PR048_022306 [Dryococelus australis]